MGTDKTFFIGHRQRLREKFDKVKTWGWQDYELLEILLTYSIKQKDVKPAAKELIKKFRTISAIMDADKNDLIKVQGIGSQSATLIQIIKEFCIKYFDNKIQKKDILNSPLSVINFTKARISGFNHELMLALFLNSRNELIHYKIIQQGTVNQVIIYPRNIVKEAILSHASGIILCHNHPSGDPAPSREDISLTSQMKHILQFLDISLLDHLIITKAGYFSFREEQKL